MSPHLFDLDTDGTARSAPLRDAHFPVRFNTMASPSAWPVGLDLASVETWRRDFKRAGDTNTFIASTFSVAAEIDSPTDAPFMSPTGRPPTVASSVSTST